MNNNRNIINNMILSIFNHFHQHNQILLRIWKSCDFSRNIDNLLHIQKSCEFLRNNQILFRILSLGHNHKLLAVFTIRIIFVITFYSKNIIIFLSCFSCGNITEEKLPSRTFSIAYLSI